MKQLYTAEGHTVQTKTGFSVFVAASDSTDYDKANADYICTGNNDQIVIQTAIDSLTQGGEVLLATGNYRITGWSYDSNGVKCAICIRNTANKSVKISGMSFPLRKKNSHDIGNTAILRVMDTAIEELDGEETRISVIGYAGTSREYPKFMIDVENIGITLASNQYPIICIDGKYFSAMIVENIICAIDANAYSSLDTGDDYDYPVDDCVAIRGLDGSNFGCGYRISNCFAFGFGCAYLLNGEHLIAEQLGCRFCNYTYKFGYDVSFGGMIHDLTLINCCHEFSSRYPAFNLGSKLQAINFYDYNVEDDANDPKFATVSKAIETTPGRFRGRVYYTVTSAQSWKNINTAFWEEGHGGNSITVNTAFPNT